MEDNGIRGCYVNGELYEKPKSFLTKRELNRRIKILTLCMALLALGELVQAIILEALIHNLT